MTRRALRISRKQERLLLTAPGEKAAKKVVKKSRAAKPKAAAPKKAKEKKAPTKKPASSKAVKKPSGKSKKA